jgi:adenylate kinase
MNIVLLGAPGAGKGTQATLLSSTLAVPHISTGDIFRHNLKNETTLGKTAKEYMDKGLLVPDEITVSIIEDRLTNYDCRNGFILDGFPRNLHQAQSLDQVLVEAGIRLDYVINFDVPDKVIVKRLTGRRICPACGKTYHIENEPPKKSGICDDCHVSLIQRADDKEETVAKRLQTYHEQTKPLIDYYGHENILVTIDATKQIAEIASEIASAMGNKILRYCD